MKPAALVAHSFLLFCRPVPLLPIEAQSEIPHKYRVFEMSDPVADLLLELYKTYKATVLSNLFMGIVFGELSLSIPRHIVSHTSFAQARMSFFMAHLSISFCEISSRYISCLRHADDRLFSLAFFC